MHDIFARVVKAAEPLYIFSVLAALFAVSMRTIVNGDFKPEVDTILTTAIGGLLGLMGTVVASIVNASKQQRDQTARASDGATGTTNTTTATVQTSTATTEPVK